jgi:hypothetical protein
MRKSNATPPDPPKGCAYIDQAGIYAGFFYAKDAPPAGYSPLPQIDNCDLQPGRYRWVPDERAEYGGAFWPVTPRNVKKSRMI